MYVYRFFPFFPPSPPHYHRFLFFTSSSCSSSSTSQCAARYLLPPPFTNTTSCPFPFSPSACMAFPFAPHHHPETFTHISPLSQAVSLSSPALYYSPFLLALLSHTCQRTLSWDCRTVRWFFPFFSLSPGRCKLGGNAWCRSVSCRHYRNSAGRERKRWYCVMLIFTLLPLLSQGRCNLKGNAW